MFGKEIFKFKIKYNMYIFMGYKIFFLFVLVCFMCDEIDFNIYWYNVFFIYVYNINFNIIYKIEKKNII